MLLFNGKRGFADVIELRLLRWEDGPGLSGWIPNEITGPSQPGDTYKSQGDSSADEETQGADRSSGREGGWSGDPMLLALQL